MRRTDSTIQSDQERDPASYPPVEPFPHIAADQLNSWLDALRVDPVSAIEYKWATTWTVGPRIVNDSMWFIVLGGTAEAWMESPSHTRTLKPGTMMLIPARVKHMIRATGDVIPNVIAVHFYATMFGGINALEMLGFPYFIQDNAKLHLRERSRHLAYEFALKPPGWKQYMAADMLQILMAMIRTLPTEFAAATDHHGHPELRRLIPAVEWIDKNLGRSDINVDDIAATVFLSPTHFRRVFHDVFGISPISFVRRKRVERAGILLRTTDLSLKEIAPQCGFRDTTYFSKTFRTLMRKTPNTYRQESIV